MSVKEKLQGESLEGKLKEKAPWWKRWKQHIDYNRNVIIAKAVGLGGSIAGAEMFGHDPHLSSMAAIGGEIVGYNPTFMALHYFSKKEEYKKEDGKVSKKKATWDMVKVYAAGYAALPVFFALMYGTNYLLQTYAIDEQWLTTTIAYCTAFVPAQCVSTAAAHKLGVLKKKEEKPKK
ncbi:MAG: hypothetical protein ABIB71_01700 [Candidatus Woesearchaeota archaeon]